VRRIGRAMLTLALFGGGIPTAIFAASAAAHVTTAPAAGACSANLASPNQQGPYTADYFSLSSTGHRAPLILSPFMWQSMRRRGHTGANDYGRESALW
jgi:hypothetical protein